MLKKSCTDSVLKGKDFWTVKSRKSVIKTEILYLVTESDNENF